MPSMRFNILIFVLIAVFVFLQYRLWLEPGGVRDLFKMKSTIEVQNQENDNMKKENEDLINQIERLQNNEDAVESRARDELGMIKKDETFYQVVK
jgi:cell division protein FtsB